MIQKGRRQHWIPKNKYANVQHKYYFKYIMRISTLNIDWGNKQKSKTHVDKIVNTLSGNNIDILIITESINSLILPNFNYAYKTKGIPSNVEYEELNYSKYLKDEIAIRVAIYSKYKSMGVFQVSDSYTSVCHQFETEKGLLTVYATIIGTQFLKMPYAQTELQNCINDCLRISKETDNLCLIGDLNTSFDNLEDGYEIKGIKSRKQLRKLCEDCDLDLTTANIPENIDHILLSKSLVVSNLAQANVFIQKGELSDHKGITVEIT